MKAGAYKVQFYLPSKKGKLEMQYRHVWATSQAHAEGIVTALLNKHEAKLEELDFRLVRIIEEPIGTLADLLEEL